MPIARPHDSMISFFTIPKPFSEEGTARAQTNAIASWKHAFPDAEVIVFGDESGIAESALRLGVRHVPSIERNELQTPLLNDAFATAERISRFSLLCYVNSDIILTRGFAATLQRIPVTPYLAIGRRTNLDVNEHLEFEADWASAILRRAHTEGRLEAPWGSDFFAFMKATGFGTLPPFAVGRPAWDNWMIGRARSLSIPVFDLTEACTVVHQNHGYGHVRQARGKTWEGVEGDRNRQLAGGNRDYTVLDADFRVLKDRVVPASRLRSSVLNVWHGSVMKRLPGSVAEYFSRSKL